MGLHLCADDLLGSRKRSHSSGFWAQWPVQKEVPGERSNCTCGVPVPPVILGGASVVADASDDEMLHSLGALPDGTAEPILFHGDRDDLPMSGCDFVPCRRVGDGRQSPWVNEPSRPVFPECAHPRGMRSENRPAPTRAASGRACAAVGDPRSRWAGRVTPPPNAPRCWRQ